MADNDTQSMPGADIFGGVDIDKIVRGSLPQASVDVGKIHGDITAIGKEEAAVKDARTDRAISQMDYDTRAVHQAHQGIEPVDLKPWNAEQEKKKYQTSPIEQFGSWGVIAATLASAFTRMPMANALNGAGAAMTAIQARDDKAYERAWESFKFNADLAIKRHNLQHEAYQDAIELLNTDRSTAMSQLQMLTDKFGDKRARALLDGGYIKELVEYQNSQRAAYQGIAQLMPQLEQMNTKREAVQYLKDQGRNPAEIYHDIYAPAYSSSLGNLKAQMIRDETAKNGGDVAAAVRKVESTFNPAKANLPANYAQEAIAGLEKDGVVLEPSTKSLVASTLGKSANSAKAAEVNSAVAGAMEEIRRRKDTDGQIDTATASQVIRDAIASATGGQTKIDAAITNQLPHYEGMKPKDLGYIGVKSQERIMAAFQSAENIEHIATFAAENPDTIGLIADSARRTNFDAYEGLFKDFAKLLPTMDKAGFATFSSKAAAAMDPVIDEEAKAKGLPRDVAENAKVLNKMLATQAFADAASAGSRGATIYLDKAFREIYQQASSPPAFFDILAVRDREAASVLSKYNLDLKNRDDAATAYPFYSDPESYLVKAVSPKAVATPLPPKEQLIPGKPYPIPGRGEMIWDGNGNFLSREEWEAKNRRGDVGGGPPPIPGSRQASDGKWYVADPDRSGKYLRVDMVA